MIGILEPSDFSEKAVAQLKAINTVRMYDGKNLKAFLKDIHILFVRLHYHLDASLLEQAPGLEVICTPTTGLNHIDLEYCRKKHIRIISLKGETAFLKTIRATPEHTLGLVIALYRNYSKAFLSSSHNEWNREKHKGYEIYGSHIGIIGLGRVGSIVSKYLQNMGAIVGYYDIADRKTNAGTVKYKSVHDLIKNSETVLLCSSYDPGTGSIINKEEIDLLEGKYFINTARAELTDETYLLKMAQRKHFRGIAIDVITHEQTTRKTLSQWLTLAERQNIIVTPHIGGATFTSMGRTEEFITGKLRAALGKK